MNSNEQPNDRSGVQPVSGLPAELFAKHVHMLGPAGPFKTSRISPELMKKLGEEQAKRDDAAWRRQREGQEGSRP
jgi:hypothetical protein